MPLYTDDPKKNYGSVPKVAVTNNSQEVESVLNKDDGINKKITAGAIILFALGVVVAVFHCSSAGIVAASGHAILTEADRVVSGISGGQPSTMKNSYIFPDAVDFTRHFRDKHIVRAFPTYGITTKELETKFPQFTEPQKTGDKITLFEENSLTARTIRYLVNKNNPDVRDRGGNDKEIANREGRIYGVRKIYTLTIDSRDKSRTWRGLEYKDPPFVMICGTLKYTARTDDVLYTIRWPKGISCQG